MKKETKIALAGLVVALGVIAYMSIPFIHTYYVVVEYSLADNQQIAHRSSVNRFRPLRNEKDVADLVSAIRVAIQKAEGRLVDEILITTLYELR